MMNSPLKKDTFVDLSPLVTSLDHALPPQGFMSAAAFNAFCRFATEEGRSYVKAPSSGEAFHKHLAHIDSGTGQIIKTPWGGVDITFRKDPSVEKFLVVNSGRYLAYEKHELKEERMEGREGLGVLLLAETPGARPTVHLMEPGKHFEIKPNHEHCLIAITNLLVFERSLDHKGMDQDLIFLYTPD